MRHSSKARLFTVLLLMLSVFMSCEDYNKLKLDPIESGETDFSNYIAVGNSLTAGLQNGALYETAQEYSFPSILARQLRMEDSFTQPLISDPGIGRRIELVSLNPFEVTLNPNQGQPVNQEEKPFSNLGIPAAVLVDYANPDNVGNLKERATEPDHPFYNPYYGIVLEQSELQKDAPNIHNQVAKQDPTFITFWLGNSDIMGFVLDGGQSQPTDSAEFFQLYQTSAELLSSTGADVVVYNIPYVTSTPFVFLLRSQLVQAGVIEFNEETQQYELVTQSGNFPVWIETDDNAVVMGQHDFPLLSATNYIEQVRAGAMPPPVQPEYAIPDSLVLDGPRPGSGGSSELELAVSTVNQYNDAIESIAASENFVLVDMNTLFENIIENYRGSDGTGGYQTDGLVLQPVPGSLFSLDGITVTNRGAAVIANETIRKVNGSLGSNIPEVDISAIPLKIPVSSDEQSP